MSVYVFTSDILENNYTNLYSVRGKQLKLMPIYIFATAGVEAISLHYRIPSEVTRPCLLNIGDGAERNPIIYAFMDSSQ